MRDMDDIDMLALMRRGRLDKDGNLIVVDGEYSSGNESDGGGGSPDNDLPYGYGLLGDPVSDLWEGNGLMNPNMKRYVY